MTGSRARKRASERTRNDRKQGPEASERTRNDRKQGPEASERTKNDRKQARKLVSERTRNDRPFSIVQSEHFEGRSLPYTCYWCVFAFSIIFFIAVLSCVPSLNICLVCSASLHICLKHVFPAFNMFWLRR